MWRSHRPSFFRSSGSKTAAIHGDCRIASTIDESLLWFFPAPRSPVFRGEVGWFFYDGTSKEIFTKKIALRIAKDHSALKANRRSAEGSASAPRMAK